ncbi:MAG: hypothetical protein JEY94_17305 [Melioribacteraceae bacterium]|nr:hypothetical protein [Melioribacteraceae bacterium]
MSKLNKVISVSRTGEISAVAITVINEYEKKDWSADTHLTGIFDALKPASENLTDAIDRNKAISNLDEKDALRDDKLRGIYYLLQGYLRYPDTTIKEAAVNVDDVFESCGLEVTNESYAMETAKIRSLLADFDVADVKTEIAKLPGLAALITELTDAEKAFEDAKTDFDNAVAKEGTENNASVIKKEVVKIINEQLVVYLRAMVQVNPATYNELALTIARTIDANNEVVKKRRKSNVDSDTDSE